MISKLKIIILKRIFPVIFALLLAFAVLLSDYVKAYATDLPVDGSWSGYDIIYTLLQSIGITISFDSGNSDGLPPGYDKESYDEFMSEAESLALQAQHNIETGDTPIQELMDELKTLPQTIKEDSIYISQDLWNYLNTYVYDDILCSQIANNYAKVTDSRPYSYGFQLSRGAGSEIDQFGIASSVGDLSFVYTLSGGEFCLYAISSSRFNYDVHVIYGDSDGGYTSSSVFSYKGYYYTRIFGVGYTDYYSGPGTLIDTSVTGYIDSLLNGDFELAPDVIWPVSGLAYDIVNHVTTWDEAIANDLITTAEDDDSVAVIPLVDTGVGEDVYENVADVVIPGVGEGESEASSEGASEAESEKADELVDSDVISSLPGTAAEAGDITKLFPFCIPFDIVSMVKGMQASEKAPVWHFKYYFKTIDYTFEFTVDMTDYEKYIKIFRAGIVIFYVITLMLITIRYSSGIVRD